MSKPLVSDMECPCDSCPLEHSCFKQEKDCKAFRIWSTKGQYNTKDKGRLIRQAN